MMTPMLSNLRERFTVINNYMFPLCETDTNILSNGISFSPAPRHLNKTEITYDLESFFTCLCLRESS